MELNISSGEEAQFLLFDSWKDIHQEVTSLVKHLLYVDKFYHYTDLNGLIGIVQNQSLFASDVRFLNDRTEFEYGMNLTKQIIESLINKKHGAILKNTIDKLDSFFPENKYVTCFSKKGDLLQQWRSYAKDGKGVSIGFHFRNNKTNLVPVVEQRRIIYRKKEQENIIKTCVIHSLRYFEQFTNWSDTKNIQFISYAIINALSDYILSFKHPCFEHENECRFLYAPKTKESDTKINFRTNGSLIIPYVLLKNEYQFYLDQLEETDAGALPTILKPDQTLPIFEIVVGPGLEYEPVKQAIEILFKENNYPRCEVKKSQLPYRV